MRWSLCVSACHHVSQHPLDRVEGYSHSIRDMIDGFLSDLFHSIYPTLDVFLALSLVISSIPHSTAVCSCGARAWIQFVESVKAVGQ